MRKRGAAEDKNWTRQSRTAMEGRLLHPAKIDQMKQLFAHVCEQVSTVGEALRGHTTGTERVNFGALCNAPCGTGGKRLCESHCPLRGQFEQHQILG
jgi:hypothetical protein